MTLTRTDPYKYYKPLTIFIVFTTTSLALNTYVVKNSLYPIYIGFSILSICLCMTLRSTYKALQTRGGLAILATFAYFMSSTILGHGQRLNTDLIFLFKAFPFFILGYIVANKPKTRYQVYYVGLAAIGFTAIYTLVSTNIFATTTREELVTQILHGSDQSRLIQIGDNFLGDFIYYFAYISFYLPFSYFLIHETSNLLCKFSVMLLQIVLTLQIIFSAWTAPVIILLISLILLAIFEGFSGNVLKIKNIANIFFIAIIAFAALVMLLNIETGVTSRVAKRINNIFFLPNELGYINSIEENSGGRITLLQSSLNGFLSNPIFGTGFNPENLNAYGGHSGILDTLAKYGIVGGLPILGTFFLFLFYSFRNWHREPQRKIHVSCLVLFISLIISNILNPYFYVSYIDQITFSAGGIAIGNHLRLSKEQKIHKWQIYRR